MSLLDALPRSPGAIGRRLFAAVLALAAFALPASSRAATKVGDSFPPLQAAGVVNLGGGALPALRGKVTLVDFWASWCAPCKASFPVMAELYQAYAPRGFQVVAVSVDDKPSAALAFWKRMAPPFVTLHDRNQKLVETVVVPTMPTSYLLDRDGRVRYVHAGFHGEVAELRKEIEALLGASGIQTRDQRPGTNDAQ